MYRYFVITAQKYLIINAMEKTEKAPQKGHF